MAIYNKGVVWVKLESTFGTDSVPTASDAIEVIDPQFEPDFNRIIRQTLEGHMSPKPGQIGRKLGNLTFQLEVKGNGTANEGKLGRLLRACWMRAVQIDSGGGAANSAFDKPIPFGSPTGSFTFTKTGTYTGEYPRRFHLYCTTPGGSAVAEFTVDSPAVGNGTGGNAAINTTGVTMTDSISFALGEGAAITPTVVDDFVVGDTFTVWALPDGYLYLPQTSTDESLTNSAVTLYYYVDGALHKMTGCRGTWSVECEGGELGLFTFNMVGDYVDATGPAFPSGNVFETTEPPQVELANLWLPYINNSTAANVGKQNKTICSSRFGFDIANNVVPRLCINAADGYNGAKIASREPSFSTDPEFIDEDDHGFWAAFETAQKWDVGALIGGNTVGNRVAFICPQLQTDSMPYGDRDGTRIVDISAMAVRLDSDAGCDEIAVWVG